MAPHNKYLFIATEVPRGFGATSGKSSALFGKVGLVCPADEGDNKWVFGGGNIIDQFRVRAIGLSRQRSRECSPTFGCEVVEI